ncbi:MAG: dienelactone hydrolase family protein [Sphingopyxis sp.]|nr:dienelactone hydrolase family protein [Sphingopyxis sp.]
MDDFFQFEVGDGAFACFIARPASEAAPVIIVLPEIFGVNDDLKRSCRDLAERGYIAICPELFWRFEPGLALNHWSGPDFERAADYYGRFDRDRGAADIALLVTAARTLPGASGKVAVMGYCLGGLMAFLVAARTGADASVCYYPGSVQDYLGEAAAIADPMLMHLAGKDIYVPVEAQRKIHAALDPEGPVTVFDYPECDHAFARHGGSEYDDAAARLAHERTWEFLIRHLR